MANTQFSGNGHSLIANGEGQIELVLMCVNNANDYFAIGDLAKQLPVNQYQLVTKDEYKAASAFGWLVGQYQFDMYKKGKEEFPTLAVGDEQLVNDTVKLVEATKLVRDLVNAPAADMMPQHLAETAENLAQTYGGQCQQIVGDDLLTHNYPTIHAVGRASTHLPRLIDLTWGDENAPKLTLVGKGVCFDSGGLDIKPKAGMRFMKKDMGGAAHVLGLAQLIMANNLNVRLRVLVPAVENAIAGNALRPGDVVTTRKGITVEIDNTDAEGRLVMCDALAEAVTEQPELLIDFATLTGAMRVALGTELPGFFATDDKTAEGITKAGLPISDPVWRMPLHQAYKDLMKSDVADMTNCATGPYGGAINAALYLQEFIEADTNWVHFDVMAFNVRHLSGRPTGGEAFGIRAVYAYLASQFS